MTNGVIRDGARRRSGRGARLLLAMGCACALAGCGTLGLSGEKAAWSQVALVASDDVNNNSPVAVDVVLVSDDAMLERVAELPASKWFAARADLLSTFPKSVRYQSYEVVPGQRLNLPEDTFDGPRVVAAFVFADYPDPGAHRVRIQKFSGRLVVQLDSNSFSVADTK